MKKEKYLLLINDWPTDGCRRVKSFDTYKAAWKAGQEFISNHIDMENKVLIINGEILSISTYPGESEENHP
jgi:hypothetical protein